MSLKKGQVGQIKGPFYANQEVAASITDTGQSVLLGITIGEKDFMTYPPNNPFYFMLNNERIIMGRTCMYELSNPIQLTRLTFPLGAPASTIIDFVCLGD